MATETLWTKLLRLIVPKGVKRTLVLITVFCELEKVRGKESPRLTSLNAQMHLFDDDMILERMADLSSVIFQSAPACPISPNASVMDNCAELLCWLPNWLAYGDRDVMVHDLAEVTVSNFDS
jgi:hypothetical protein